MAKQPLQFPPLADIGFEPWHWPRLPFVWNHQPVRDREHAQPCRIESLRGETAIGETVGLNSLNASFSFRTSADRPDATISLTRIRRLTLTEPLRPVAKASGDVVSRLPIASHERSYRLHPPGDAPVISGRTVSHVEDSDGLYLFEPVEDAMALLRSFVPRSAYIRCEFGPSAEQIAAERWITTPRQLVDAIEQQKQKKISRIGQSFLELGLLTERQLEQALAQQTGEAPLGKMLVEQGLLSQHNLQTAIAHKLGYPFVDLTRFPIDIDVVRMLSPQMALKATALPLMFDKERLIVALDDPARATRLRPVHAFSDLKVVPVLASKIQIVNTLASLTKNDLWVENAGGHVDFFHTTI